jgi:hypothetical protein
LPIYLLAVLADWQWSAHALSLVARFILRLCTRVVAQVLLGHLGIIVSVARAFVRLSISIVDQRMEPLKEMGQTFGSSNYLSLQHILKSVTIFTPKTAHTYSQTHSHIQTQLHHNFHPLPLAIPTSCLTAKSAIISSLPPPTTIILKSLEICSTALPL